MTVPEESLQISDISSGAIRVAQELHVTGGIRAFGSSAGFWAWHPVTIGGAIHALKPVPINSILNIAKNLGAELFGGNEISGLGASLHSRVWTPLDGPYNGQPQPADLWINIAANADRAGDRRYAELANHISFSLRAAGIRLRDASDHYRDQLLAAIEEKRKPGILFSNLPLSDLQLAFHSVLSELGSARDYLGVLLGYSFNAPPSIDAMNRFKRWVSKAAHSDLRLEPIVDKVLRGYDQTSSDPWLADLSEYRNEFLHRRPLGSGEGARWLRLCEYERNGVIYPFIEMPLGPSDSSAPGQDSLHRFVSLQRCMTALMRDAAASARYAATPAHLGAQQMPWEPSVDWTTKG
ncbi:hypothetical protein [Falsiroseomonas sp. E2-1-a20]|uniref:hypothetical protein n=1 Tax=Falsiroseomonas sp. E2-1-a20 TaxID=3239300 RepID=UPI003F3F8F7D